MHEVRRANPIPQPAKAARPRDGVALTRAEADRTLVVDRFTERLEHDREALALLERLGIAPGVRLYLRGIDEAADTVRFERAGREGQLPLAVAAGARRRNAAPRRASTTGCKASSRLMRRRRDRHADHRN